jgi:hypothetical protein
VTGNKAYAPGASYNGKNPHVPLLFTQWPSCLAQNPRTPFTNAFTRTLVFAGKDASRALGKTSTKPEDALPEWHDLSDKEKGVLQDWVTFFSKRYNVVGVVEGATNTD